MAKILILAAKPLLGKKEEKAFARAYIQVESSAKFDEDFIETVRTGFDIIVIDNNLRGVDSYQACCQIRALSRATIILLGDTPSWEMWEKRPDIGFDRYYRKPLKSRELAYRIKLTLSKRNSAAFNEPDSGKIKSNITGNAAGDTPCPADATLSAPPDDDTRIWQNPRAARLIGSLLSGKTTRLDTEIGLHLKDGFAYREADAIMGTSGKETALILESLAKDGVLTGEESGKILASPDGSVQLIPVERCPRCDSAQLTRGQLIEHFTCGHIGPEGEFNRGLRQVCPKCQRELKLIGTDYRRPGSRYVCNSCHEMFPSPRIKCHCLNTGEFYNLDELHHIVVYSYRLNETIRKRLEFELEPKKQLLGYLHQLGYEVQESVPVPGRSGVAHTIDLLASSDDPLTGHTLAIGILPGPDDKASVGIDSLLGFDGRTRDAGIDDRMVIAVPGVTPEAAKFAEQQGIKVYHIAGLRALLGQFGLPMADNGKKQPAAVPGDEPDLARLGLRGWLRWVLERKGYYVAENVRIKGRSGTGHSLDFYAQKDNGIMNHRIAIDITVNDDDAGKNLKQVIQLEAAAADAGIHHKIIIAAPGFSREARQFAEYQRIMVLESGDLAELSRKYRKLTMQPASAVR